MPHNSQPQGHRDGQPVGEVADDKPSDGEAPPNMDVSSGVPIPDPSDWDVETTLGYQSLGCVCGMIRSTEKKTVRVSRYRSSPSGHSDCKQVL